ncbi:hypothetical protein PIB30_010282 [Stylosanthes scabra]|uniref:Uncharacterized protein n=1 Tax=Stylosanthes scabra TaxID=79078 RepID=A0ABU6T5F4_9FABA|nr:hypothetical protein [Stylosanthes scabra]
MSSCQLTHVGVYELQDAKMKFKIARTIVEKLKKKEEKASTLWVSHGRGRPQRLELLKLVRIQCKALRTEEAPILKVKEWQRRAARTRFHGGHRKGIRTQPEGVPHPVPVPPPSNSSPRIHSACPIKRSAKICPGKALQETLTAAASLLHQKFALYMIQQALCQKKAGSATSCLMVW